MGSQKDHVMNKLITLPIYYVQQEGPVLTIESPVLPTSALQILLRDEGIILWENRGMFKLIPAPVIRNTLASYEDAQVVAAGYTRTVGPSWLREVSWSQGIPVPSDVARKLLSASGNGGNDLSDPKPTTQANSED